MLWIVGALAGARHAGSRRCAVAAPLDGGRGARTASRREIAAKTARPTPSRGREGARQAEAAAKVGGRQGEAPKADAAAKARRRRRRRREGRRRVRAASSRRPSRHGKGGAKTHRRQGRRRRRQGEGRREVQPRRGTTSSTSCSRRSSKSARSLSTPVRLRAVALPLIFGPAWNPKRRVEVDGKSCYGNCEAASMSRANVHVRIRSCFR